MFDGVFDGVFDVVFDVVFVLRVCCISVGSCVVAVLGLWCGCVRFVLCCVVLCCVLCVRSCVFCRGGLSVLRAGFC